MCTCPGARLLVVTRAPTGPKAGLPLGVKCRAATFLLFKLNSLSNSFHTETQKMKVDRACEISRLVEIALYTYSLLATF